MTKQNDISLHIVDAGTFLCDGGGIFGGVPKVLWSRYAHADERNMIKLAMRCLLVEMGDRRILIETGAGNKLDEKFARNNGIENPDQLLESLAKLGFMPADITDVIHTHLHWDHCGGGTRIENRKLTTTFPNAIYYSTRSQWENANNANKRESDAYFDNDLLPVTNSGQLTLIDKEMELYPGIELRIFNGHTPGMIVPVITVGNKKLAYVSDLAPTLPNIPLKWIAAYDLFPVTAMEEKERFFKEAHTNSYIIFFEHDLENECCTIDWNDKKGPIPGNKGSLKQLINQQ